MMRLAAIGVLLLQAGVAGCGEDLGECEMTAARAVVYDESGLPAYEGQALITASCGNGAFCHSAQATGMARYGAPGDLNFDLALAAAGPEAAEAAVERLGRGRDNVRGDAELIMCAVEDGTMPPWGEATLAVHRNLPRFRRVATDGTETRLPHVDSFEGLAILRNWLACDAPVVERTEGSGSVGDVVPAGPPE